MNPDQSFRVVDDTAQCVAGPFKTLRQAVLAAVRHDGYGGCFERMNFEGHIHPTFPMRLFTSRRHIGNNPYFPTAQESFAPHSLKLDDMLAQDEVALEIFLAGTLHYRHQLKIEVVPQAEAVKAAAQTLSDSA